MEKTINLKTKIGWLLGSLILVLGALNLFLVHLVPGLIFLLLSLLILPLFDNLFLKKLGFAAPFGVKILLAVVLIWFTLGVSDLGDILDDWLV